MNIVAAPIGNARTQQAAATRKALLDNARILFEERGYFEIGTPELAAAVGLTRGALYHHFANKYELFVEVFRIVERELFEEAMSLFQSDWVTDEARLRYGVVAYLKAVAASPGRQRIMLIDGPAVLGWVKWREMESASFRDLQKRNLAQLAASGVMRNANSEYLSRLLLAAFNESALAIAHAEPAMREIVRGEVTASLQLLIEGLLISPHPQTTTEKK